MKRTFSVLFTVFFAIFMSVAACALTLDVAEAETDFGTLSEDAILSAEVVPGLNIVNGTPYAETFDAAGQKVPGGLITEAAPSISAEKAYSGTHSIKGVGSSTYPKLRVCTAEKDRLYYLSFKTAVDPTTIGEYQLWLIENGTVKKSYQGAYESAGKAGEWFSVGESYRATTDTQIYFQTKANTNGVIYFDDVLLIPYYKVTYIGLDGETVVATEQFLFDTNGDFVQFYVPDLSKVEGATGYSLTKGGERISEVKPNYEDIVLYALDTPVVSLAYGEKTVSVEVTDETFTFPAVADNFTITENFLCYSDGYSFYNEGKTVNAADVIGKTFTVVDSKYTKFNTSYGELVMLIDYDLAGVTTATGSPTSGKVVPSYLNREYVAGNVEHTDGNCVLSYAVTKENGNKVLKFRTSDKNVYNYWCLLVTSKVGGKYTSLEDVKAEDTQGIAMENMFKGPWHRFMFDGTYKALSTPNPTAEWSVASVSYTVPNGITGTGFSYNRAKNTYLPNIYKDNHAVYVYAKNTVYFMTEKNGTSAVKATYDASATTFKMPTAEEIGMNVANVVGWKNGTKSYKVGAEVAVSELANTAFYPVCQSAEEPAMGFTFEGERKASGVEVGGPIYTENIIDDGRNVLLVHAWNGKNGEGQSFPSDSRLSFRSGTAIPYYNPAEYNILQYSVKFGDMWAVVKEGDKVTGYTKTPTQNITVHAHTTAGGAYTNPVITCISKALSTSDNYNIVEQDMSGNANFITKAGYGFCIEPCKATYGYYVYMDYFRVYRKGFQTVNYNTNAPEGATVLKEVASDKNRGLGYGYLLKDERPAVEGYTFLGWALTPDATETVNSITVDGDETVYAVWAKAEEKTAPAMTDTTEIRGNGEANGIRFKSEISPSVKASLSEFGFLATREVLLPFADAGKTSRDYTALTFLHKVNGVKANYYVQGVAYDADGEIDVINRETDDGNIVYTTVLSGIPMEKKAEKMVVRPYAKYIVNGKEAVVYGNASSASLYETALAIKTENGAAYASNKEYVDSILAE